MPTVPLNTDSATIDGSNIDPNAGITEQPKEIKHIRVYLTGYGPFRSIAVNPSSEITQSFLPSTTIDIHPPSTPHLTLRITLQPHDSSVRVAYADVDAAISEIYNTQSFDYILHVGVGLAGGYELEKIAYGEGYHMGDVDGKVPSGGKAKSDEALKKEGLLHHWGGDGSGGTGKGQWMGTGLDVDWIANMIQAGKIKLTAAADETSEGDHYTASIAEKDDPPLPTAATTKRTTKRSSATAAKKGYKIHPSTDAGRYLCEYIFRESLEQAISRRRKGARKPWDRHNDPAAVQHEKDNLSKRVLFMHVPPAGNLYTVPEGIDCLKQVVVGMVLDGEGLRKV